MEAPYRNGLAMPDQLESLAVATEQVVNKAHEYEADINATSGSCPEKIDLLRSAVTSLDIKAGSVFMGQQVQIEGNYNYPHPVLDEDEFVIKSLSQYGIHRGESLGFYGSLVPIRNDEGEVRQDTADVQISHGVVLGDLAFANSLFSINGRANILAPIGKSTLSLCVVEDYKQQALAELSVRQNRRDSRWTDKIDEALYHDTGPNLQLLGTRLSRLRAIREDRIDEYLEYVNVKIGADKGLAILLCDYLMVYKPGEQEPTIAYPEELVFGYSPVVCFATSYRPEPLGQRAYRLSKPSPMLSLRATPTGKNVEHIIHVPLTAIRSSEFK